MDEFEIDNKIKKSIERLIGKKMVVNLILKCRIEEPEIKKHVHVLIRLSVKLKEIKRKR